MLQEVLLDKEVFFWGGGYKEVLWGGGEADLLLISILIAKA